MIAFFAWGTTGVVVATIVCTGLPLLALYHARTFVTRI
ncbi:hypothetical protein XINFAN_01770 [Pseudogemmobacter humi]|uniref:Uncharacterized protein n=1 Tax=Pseudogemmobacter humi TaxID=2483812 RepID=A0A3P5XEX1_9RHOB|nr:hypothetical protein XINFAN_01770 [Pseudogemmobacter humi]